MSKTIAWRLAQVGLKAIEAHDLERDFKIAKAELNGAYVAFKEKRGIDSIKEGSTDWSEMMHATKEEYAEKVECGRMARNARYRLNTAIKNLEK